MGERIVLGANSGSGFAVYGGRVFSPAANGIVITRSDGSDSTFWQPTNGCYAIENLTISSKGVLCFSERRLSVVLHFYNAVDLRKLHEVPDVAKVCLRSLAFDETGEVLYALSTIPTSTVKVFTASRYGGMSLSHEIPAPTKLNDGDITPVGAGFLLSGRNVICGFAPQSDGQFVEGFNLSGSLLQSGLSAVAVGRDNCFLYATVEGKVYRRALSGNDKSEDIVFQLDDKDDEVAALYAMTEDNTLYVSCESGTLLQTALPSEDAIKGNSVGGVILETQVPHAVRAIVPADDSATALLLGTDCGLYKLDVDESSVDSTVLTPVRHRFRSDIVGCHSTASGKHVIVVCSDGSFVVTDLETDVNCYYHASGASRGTETVLDSCLVDNMLVVIHGSDHSATVHDPLTGRFVTKLPYGNEDAKPTKCVSNPAGFLIVFDERCVFFYRPCADGHLLPCGFFVADPLVMMSSIISTARGLPAPVAPVGSACTADERAEEEGRFLVTCSNGEIYLVNTPLPSVVRDSSAAVEHSAEQVLLGMWRVDFPIVDLFPCYVDVDVVNIMVHSLDKDTKLYALDRRHGKDPKSAVVRPYFLMRDHESGGRCLSILQDGTTLCSAGKDGRIVLRDVAPYQKKLTPIPPSKEKRKPVGETTVWHFTDGGVGCIAVAVGDTIACAGGGYSSTVLKLVASPLPKNASKGERSWKEPTWCFKEQQGGLDDCVSKKALGGADKQLSPTDVVACRQETADQVQALRAEWAEQMRSLEDVGVAVDDLLLEKERCQFQDTCSEAIFEMREDEYYSQLENQYTQEVIKQRCCETMEVPRAKVASLISPNMEVFNFHIAKQCRPRLRVAKKLAFLRVVQRRAASSLFANSEARGNGECGGFYFQQHYEPSGCEAVLPTEPFPGQDAGKRSQTAASENPFNDVTPVGSDTVTALKEALYPPCDVYTCGRSCLQLGLLKGLALSLKDAFNQEFNLLKQKKQSALTLIDERTQRCVQILKQLGEVTSSGGNGNIATLETLFAARVDKEEDPNTLFTVHDDELDEAVRALIPQKQGATIYSPENEAAIKLWMDGLEKDVELVRVTLAVPDFADEAKESFVPFDERTDEQARLYEEYEKKLKEETEAVEARKEALRNELRSLQKTNRTCAQELDEALSRLRARRVATAERIHERELQVVQLTQQCLKPEDAVRQFTDVEVAKACFQKQILHVEVAVEMKQNAVTAAIVAMNHAEEEVRRYVEELPEVSPFQDESHGEKLLRRFGRWKRKFDDGKGEIPNVAKSPEDCPEELWQDFCEHCEYLLSLRDKVSSAAARHQAEEEALQMLEEERVGLMRRTEEAEADQNRVALSLLPRLLDTATLYNLHQGEVQDETAAMTSDFRSSCLRWTSNVAQYNDLVLSSSAESGKLRDKIVRRRLRMKELVFETKRLQYCIGTLRLELRQLHTLRVTRLMQEWLAGDADVSEDKAIAKLDHHIAYVNDNMSRKIGDLERAVLKIRAQLSERGCENAIVSQEVDELRSAVQDATTIQSLVHSDGTSQFTQRAREIYETSELEELARCQQEELIRLKKTVDSLRERTFPSFAVVSKQRM